MPPWRPDIVNLGKRVRADHFLRSTCGIVNAASAELPAAFDTFFALPEPLQSYPNPHKLLGWPQVRPRPNAGRARVAGDECGH
jgi:hypothetical protein